MYKITLSLIVAFFTFMSTSCSTSSVTTDSANTGMMKDISLYKNQPAFCPTITQKKLATCRAKQGKMLPQGKAQCFSCTIEFNDAGKQCMSSHECQGTCENRGKTLRLGQKASGQCASNNQPFGCKQRIENGIASEPMRCID